MSIKKFFLALFLSITIIVAGGALALHIMCGGNLSSFVSGFLRDPAMVGACVPCSSFVAQEVASAIDVHRDQPYRILEVGAGTGVMTQKIIERMRPTDLLDAVEVDPAYCRVLEQKFGAIPNVRIKCQSIYDFQPFYQYDVIVSTLPFNNFSVDQLQHIQDTYERLIKPGGWLTYVEYIGLMSVKRATLTGNALAEHDARQEIIRRFKDKHHQSTTTVLLNLPPIYVHHLQINQRS